MLPRRLTRPWLVQWTTRTHQRCVSATGSTSPPLPTVPPTQQRGPTVGITSTACTTAARTADELSSLFRLPRIADIVDIEKVWGKSAQPSTLPAFLVVVGRDGGVELVDTCRAVVRRPFALPWAVNAADVRADGDDGSPGVVQAVQGKDGKLRRCVENVVWLLLLRVWCRCAYSLVVRCCEVCVSRCALPFCGVVCLWVVVAVCWTAPAALAWTR